MQIKFIVYGESTEPDQVVFTKNNNEIDVTCTCQLVEGAPPCEHVIDMLDGLTDKIVSVNKDEVQLLKEWLPGTLLGKVYDVYKEAEADLTVRSRFTHAKNRLSCQVKAPTTYDHNSDPF